MKKIGKPFKKAVLAYLSAIGQEFNSIRDDDDFGRKPCKLKIIELFKKIPRAARIDHLLFLLKTMIGNTNNPGLTDWCRSLALELVEELEKS